MKTFRERYCERHGIALDEFERVLVRLSLHWQARLLYGLLALDSEYYSADYELVRSIGDLRSRRGFHNEVAEYHYHPRNRSLLRKVLRMRVSSQRLKKIFDQEMAGVATAPPFSGGKP
jgi:hypothetical protein